jgi:hypothetical protein
VAQAQGGPGYRGQQVGSPVPIFSQRQPHGMPTCKPWLHRWTLGRSRVHASRQAHRPLFSSVFPVFLQRWPLFCRRLPRLAAFGRQRARLWNDRTWNEAWTRFWTLSQMQCTGRCTAGGQLAQVHGGHLLGRKSAVCKDLCERRTFGAGAETVHFVRAAVRKCPVLRRLPTFNVMGSWPSSAIRRFENNSRSLRQAQSNCCEKNLPDFSTSP